MKSTPKNIIKYNNPASHFDLEHRGLQITDTILLYSPEFSNSNTIVAHITYIALYMRGSHKPELSLNNELSGDYNICVVINDRVADFVEKTNSICQL